MCYQCGHLEETDPAPKGPLSRPHFTQMAAILSKSQECSRHSTNATPSTSGGMRSGWWLCRARLCHLTWVEGEAVVKQYSFFLPSHATHVGVRDRFLQSQRLRPAGPRAMGPEPQPLKAQVSLIPSLPPAAVWLLMPAVPLCASVSFCTRDSYTPPKSVACDSQAHFSRNLPQAAHPALLTPVPRWLTVSRLGHLRGTQSASLDLSFFVYNMRAELSESRLRQ